MLLSPATQDVPCSKPGVSTETAGPSGEVLLRLALYRPPLESLDDAVSAGTSDTDGDSAMSTEKSRFEHDAPSRTNRLKVSLCTGSHSASCDRLWRTLLRIADKVLISSQANVHKARGRKLQPAVLVM